MLFSQLERKSPTENKNPSMICKFLFNWHDCSSQHRKVGNFFSKLHLVSDINIRYHVLHIQFINKTNEHGLHHMYFYTNLTMGA